MPEVRILGDYLNGQPRNPDRFNQMRRLRHLQPRRRVDLQALQPTKRHHPPRTAQLPISHNRHPARRTQNLRHRHRPLPSPQRRHPMYLILAILMVPQILNPQLYFKGDSNIEITINIKSDSSVDKLLLEYGFFDPETSTTLILGSDWVLSHCSAIAFPCPKSYWCRYDLKPVVTIKDIKYSEPEPTPQNYNIEFVKAKNNSYWTTNDSYITVYHDKSEIKSPKPIIKIFPSFPYPADPKLPNSILCYLPAGSIIKIIESIGLWGYWKQITIISSSNQSIRPGITGWIDSRTIQSITPGYTQKP